MSSYKIAFDKMPWSSGKGVRTKTFEQNGDRIKLMEMDETFEEKDWCTKAHRGIVIRGSLEISFSGKMISYKSGDTIWIDEGPEHRHKAIIQCGESSLIILFEKT